MRCIVLAGGFGTRLKTVVSEVPKPMAPINGTPFVALLMRHLKQYGVTEFVLSEHHLKESLVDYFLDRYEGLPVRHVAEDTPLGTGGGMVHCLYAMGAMETNEPVLVVNGDTFVKMDYAAMFAQHQASDAPLSMALRHIPDTGRSGVVTQENGTITSFGARGEDGVAGLINAGVYVVTPSLFAGYADGQVFSFEHDFMAVQAPTLGAEAFMAEDYFIDIGVPADYARAQVELESALQ